MHHYLITCLSLLLASLPVVAEPVDNLYQGEVVVANHQNNDQRSESMRQALLQVLSRLVQSDVVKSGKLKEVLDQPYRYVSQYRYLRRTGEIDSTQRLLQVQFNQRAIEQALKSSRLAVWGADRPSLLVWLVELDQKQWFKPDMRLQWRRALTAAAKKKGIPLVLPLMDLTDRQHLSYLDAQLNEQIVQASRRYKPDATLFGRLSASTEDSWNIQWTLFHAGEVQQWLAKSRPLAAMMDSGVGGAYERLVMRKTPVSTPVITASEPGGVILKVSGVSDLHALARVTAYLKSVKQLRSIQWLQVRSDELWLQLLPRDKVTGLRQSFDSSGVFQAVYTENSEGVMHYRLLSLATSEMDVSGDD